MEGGCYLGALFSPTRNRVPYIKSFDAACRHITNRDKERGIGFFLLFPLLHLHLHLHLFVSKLKTLFPMLWRVDVTLVLCFSPQETEFPTSKHLMLHADILAKERKKDE
jgi:hypothetical protein